MFPSITSADGNPSYDLLNQAFEEARNHDYVVWKWNTPQTIWWEIFNPTWNFDIKVNQMTNDLNKINDLLKDGVSFDDIDEVKNVLQWWLSEDEIRDILKWWVSEDELRDLLKRKGIDYSKEQPYIIRITKLIIRVWVALSVGIVIIWGIMYIVAFGDEGKQKKARNIVIYALVWLLISLWALAIVQLATTITKNSLWVIS